MQCNNFDQSSTGINISLSCFLDSIQSQDLYDESIYQLIKNPGFSVFNPNDLQHARDFDFLDANNYDLSNYSCMPLFNKYCEFSFNTALKNIGDHDINDLAAALDMYCCDTFNSSDLLSKIIDHCDDRASAMEFIDLAGLKKKFAVITSRGYSQGDYRTVIVPPEVIADYGFKNTQEASLSLQDEIDHLLWDCPVYCRIEINGSEYDLCDGDIYDYDKEKVIKEFESFVMPSDIKAACVAFLNQNLPDYPDTL